MIEKDKARMQLTRYTLKALGLVPDMVEPLILDIGCGTGIPTITLAKATGGKVIGIDNNEDALRKFEDRINKEKLTSSVESKLCDLREIPFEDQTFDLLWAEGSIAFIGFEEGLIAWRRLIKPAGYLVIHDEAGDLNLKTEMIDKHGYRLINSFTLQENIWWDEYYNQLHKEIGEHYLDGGLSLEGEALEIYKEIEMYQVSPERFRSVYFILQKRDR